MRSHFSNSVYYRQDNCSQAHTHTHKYETHTCGMSTEYLISSKVRESGVNGRTMPFLSDPIISRADFTRVLLFLIELPCRELRCRDDDLFPLDDPSKISPVRFACFSFIASSDIEG